MQNSYYQIAQMFSRKATLKQFDEMFHQPEKEDPRFQDDFFIKVFIEMKEKFQVSFKFIGEENFKILVYEYLRNVPYQNDDYGHLFPEFIGQIPVLEQMRYLKWIAKLDWFWFADNKESITLPKGTLNSWGNLQRDEEQIQIEIDESVMERLVVKKFGNEFKIVAV